MGGVRARPLEPRSRKHLRSESVKDKQCQNEQLWHDEVCSINEDNCNRFTRIICRLVQRIISASGSIYNAELVKRAFMRRGFSCEEIGSLWPHPHSFSVQPRILRFRVWAQDANAALGLFQNQTDVGSVLHPGSVAYDPAKHSYTISGSGENMWFAADAFQFVWKKLSGDVTLSADISFLTKTGNEHKKAVLIFDKALTQTRFMRTSRYMPADSLLCNTVTKRARSQGKSNRISQPPSACGSQNAEITFIWH